VVPAALLIDLREYPRHRPPDIHSVYSGERDRDPEAHHDRSGAIARSSTIGVTVTSKKQIAKSELEALETRRADRLTSLGRFRRVLALNVALNVTPDDTRDSTLVVGVLTLPEGSIWDYSFFGEGEVMFDVTLIERSTGAGEFR
jgi:hypothetical protein